MAGNWKPRCSSHGAYMLCQERMHRDREAGPQEEVRSAYADLGTLIHWRLMNDIGGEFGPLKEAPTQAHRDSAASLFEGDFTAMDARIAEAASEAASVLPATDGGWHVETNLDGRYRTGTADFLSRDFLIIGDLKTTSRRPDHGRLKALHLYQLLAYSLAVEESYGIVPRSAWVLYCGSVKRFDPVLVAVDLADPAVVALRDRLKKESRGWPRRKRAVALAVPGPHCDDTFCRYRPTCRDGLCPSADDTPLPPIAPASATPFAF